MIRVIKKVNLLLDKRQKSRVLLLGILMLIGGIFETLGVSMIIPLATAILDSEVLSKKTIVVEICRIMNITDMTQFLVLIICAIIAIYIIKNAFLMFQYYVQYRFICNNKYIVQTRLFQAFYITFTLHLCYICITFILQNCYKNYYT